MAGSSKEFGAVGGAAIGEEALDFDAMVFVEAESLIESDEDAGQFFVWKETGEGEAGMVVDGDVETFDTGAWVAEGAIPGGADAGEMEAAKLLEARGGGVRRAWRVRSAEGALWEVPEKRGD